MISLLRKKQPQEQTLCVLSVTDYSVTASSVRVYHRPGAIAQPLVLFSCEEKITYVGTNQLLRDQAVQQASKYVLEQCRRIQGGYDRLVCVIGDPWVLTKMREVAIEKQQPFTVTQKMIDEAIARDARLVEQEALREYAHDTDWWLLPQGKPLLMSNGYQIDDKAMHRGKKISIHTMISLVPVAFIEMMTGVFIDVFHREDINYRSSDRSIQHVLRSEQHVYALNLSGGSGSLAYYQKGVLVDKEFLSLGFHHFETVMMELFQVNRRQIPGIMSLVTDQSFLEHEQDRYYRRIKKAFHDLGNEIYRSIHTLNKRQGISDIPIVMIGGPQWSEQLCDIFKRDYDDIFLGSQKYSEHMTPVYSQGVRITNSLTPAILMTALEQDYYLY